MCEVSEPRFFASCYEERRTKVERVKMRGKKPTNSASKRYEICQETLM